MEYQIKKLITTLRAKIDSPWCTWAMPQLQAENQTLQEDKLLWCCLVTKLFTC